MTVALEAQVWLVAHRHLSEGGQQKEELRHPTGTCTITREG